MNSSQQLLTCVIDKGHLNFLGIYTILLRYAIHVLLVVRIIVPTIAHALCLHTNSHIIIIDRDALGKRSLPSEVIFQE